MRRTLLFATLVVRVAFADRAFPTFPESQRQDGNTEDVYYIECPNPDGHALRGAGEAIIVPKLNSFRTPVVDTVNNDHDSASEELSNPNIAFFGRIAPQLTHNKRTRILCP